MYVCMYVCIHIYIYIYIYILKEDGADRLIHPGMKELLDFGPMQALEEGDNDNDNSSSNSTINSNSSNNSNSNNHSNSNYDNSNRESILRGAEGSQGRGFERRST